MLLKLSVQFPGAAVDLVLSGVLAESAPPKMLEYLHTRAIMMWLIILRVSLVILISGARRGTNESRTTVSVPS